MYSHPCVEHLGPPRGTSGSHLLVPKQAETAVRANIVLGRGRSLPHHTLREDAQVIHAGHAPIHGHSEARMWVEHRRSQEHSAPLPERCASARPQQHLGPSTTRTPSARAWSTARFSASAPAGGCSSCTAYVVSTQDRGFHIFAIAHAIPGRADTSAASARTQSAFAAPAL
jgi:hypothetical protein